MVPIFVFLKKFVQNWKKQKNWCLKTPFVLKKNANFLLLLKQPNLPKINNTFNRLFWKGSNNAKVAWQLTVKICWFNQRHLWSIYIWKLYQCFDLSRPCQCFDLSRPCECFVLSRPSQCFNLSRLCQCFDLSRPCQCFDLSKTMSMFRFIETMSMFRFIETMPMFRFIETMSMFRFIETMSMFRFIETILVTSNIT